MLPTSTVTGVKTRYTCGEGGGKGDIEGEEAAAGHSSSPLTLIFHTDGMHQATASTI